MSDFENLIMAKTYKVHNVCVTREMGENLVISLGSTFCDSIIIIIITRME